jgi:hypothetical protein
VGHRDCSTATAGQVVAGQALVKHAGEGVDIGDIGGIGAGLGVPGAETLRRPFGPGADGGGQLDVGALRADPDDRRPPGLIDHEPVTDGLLGEFDRRWSRAAHALSKPQSPRVPMARLLRSAVNRFRQRVEGPISGDDYHRANDCFASHPHAAQRTHRRRRPQRRHSVEPRHHHTRFDHHPGAQNAYARDNLGGHLVAVGRVGKSYAPISVNNAEPMLTSAMVCSPAIRDRPWRSKPIATPSSVARRRGPTDPTQDGPRSCHASSHRWPGWACDSW